MITLLLAVFIVLYSFSVVDLKKFEAVAGALGDQFHGAAGGPGVIGGGKGILSGARGVTSNPAALVNGLKCTINSRLPEELRERLTVTCRGHTVTISMQADTLTFPIGRARLTDEVRQILEVLGPSLRESLAPLLIEGHTCDLPIETERYPSNWELSAQRATNVMVYLIRHAGIDPDHVSAVGYADTRPLVPNDSEVSRIRNRRVDIVVLSENGHPGRPDGATSTSRTNDSLRLRPVRLRPTIDLPARYYQHTGRRTVDTPTADPAHAVNGNTRRGVHTCD
jgi:chemotaxis protein MotB